METMLTATDVVLLLTVGQTPTFLILAMRRAWKTYTSPAYREYRAHKQGYKLGREAVANEEHAIHYPVLTAAK